MSAEFGVHVPTIVTVGATTSSSFLQAAKIIDTANRV